MTRMSAQQLLSCRAALLLPALLAVAAAQNAAAETPQAPSTAARAEAEPTWGAPEAGLVVAVRPEGALRSGGPLRLALLVRSAAGGAVALPPAAEAFAWVTAVQTFGDDRATFYSQKVPMPADAWPAQVAGEKVLTLGPFDLADAKAYPRSVGRTLLTAYLSGDETDLPKPAGVLGGVLKPGAAMVRVTLCLRRPGQTPTVIHTAPTAVTVDPPDLAALPAGDRTAFFADLMKQFDKDPWSGKQAHDTCVGLGQEALPHVLKAAFETGRPAHARLWLATTLADIRDPRSAEALARLLDDPSAGVRHVVAYHGPKQKSAALDAAIIRKATADDAAHLAAWALLGFMVQRGTVPEAVLKAGLESDDPRARGTAAEVLARHASDENLARLVALLADTDQQVRGVAAKMLGQANRPEPKVLGALVRALDLPGESARQRICQALSALTGTDRPYDPAADAPARAAVLAAWKAWWAQRKP